MTIYLAYTAVFLLAAIPFLEVVGVIPIGVAAGLPALPVTVLAFLGNIATIWLLIFLMGQIKAWLQRREEEKGKSRPKKREERAARIWKRYGLPGLALVSPILIGSHLGAILAMTFGGTKETNHLLDDRQHFHLVGRNGFCFSLRDRLSLQAYRARGISH
ncbi:MAG: small multi-drug export protein [Clostridia bacterium]|nr:small multi-drug export protein [Clostridia bacterium]